MTRVLRSTWWVKALPLVLVFKLGWADRDAAIVTLVIAGVYMLWLFTRGRRWARTSKEAIRHNKQFIEPMESILARHSDNLVWDHAVFTNMVGGQPESADDGIVRLRRQFGLEGVEIV